MDHPSADLAPSSGVRDLGWPKEKGAYRLGPRTDTVEAAARSIDATDFATLAAAWRRADHAAITAEWGTFCGAYWHYVNSHQALWDVFQMEPTERLVDGLDFALRRAAALGLPTEIDPTDAALFVATWTRIANTTPPDDFGPLLLDPPDAWAAGLVLGTVTCFNADSVPACVTPLAGALEAAVADASARRGEDHDRRHRADVNKRAGSDISVVVRTVRRLTDADAAHLGAAWRRVVPARDRREVARHTAEALVEHARPTPDQLRRDIEAAWQVAASAAHPEIPAGAWLDCAPPITEDWGLALEAAYDAALGLLVAGRDPAVAHLLIEPWRSVIGPRRRHAF